MRISTSSVLLALLALGACAPAYEDGHLSREINKQRALRDACLSSQVTALDDRSSSPSMIGQQAAMACTSQNDRLIQLLSTMDRSGVDQITIATRKDAVMKATTYALKARGEA